MASNPVIIFGAGATKACGGPLTNEILLDLYNHCQELEREGFLDLLDKFLVDSFNLPENVGGRTKEHYPGLPLLLSLLDVSIDKKQPMGAEWGTDTNEIELEGTVLLLNADLAQTMHVKPTASAPRERKTLAVAKQARR